MGGPDTQTTGRYFLRSGKTLISTPTGSGFSGLLPSSLNLPTDSPFTVYTDHISLKYVQSLKMSTGRLLRWSLQLQQYTFDVRFKKGKTNTNADALSRRSYPISSDGHDDAEEHLLAQVDNEVQQVDLNLIVEDDLIAPKEPDGDAFLIETANEQNKCLDCQPFIRYLESGELPENDKDARKLVIEISEYALHDRSEERRVGK